MPRYKRHATKALALAESESICDRIMPQPREERVTRYWHSIEEDGDSREAVLVIEDESRLLPAEVAELVEEADLPAELKNHFFILDLANRLQNVTRQELFAILSAIGPEKLRRLAEQIANDPALQAALQDILTKAQWNQLKARLPAVTAP